MNLTAQEIAGEITMRCIDNSAPFLLVEGPIDFDFFSCRMTLKTENIIPTYGWEQLVEAISILESEGKLNVLGIIDLDYRDIITSTKIPDNVFTTDSRDLETMMFDSPAFYRVFVHYSSKRKLQTYYSGIDGIKNKILETGRPIGSIRFYSELKAKNYSFKEIDYDKFIDRHSLELSHVKFISHLRGKHPNNKSIPDDVLELALKETDNFPILANLCRLCCGHDLIAIMAIGLKSLWGSHSSREISPDAIENSFILSYSHEMFGKCNLFKNISKWFEVKRFEAPWIES